MNKWLNTKKGVTLIEVIVSLAILGIILIPLSTLFVMSIKTNIHAEDRLRVQQIAQSYMESIRYLEPTDAVGFETGNLMGFTMRWIIEPNIKYKKQDNQEDKSNIVIGDQVISAFKYVIDIEPLNTISSYKIKIYPMKKDQNTLPVPVIVQGNQNQQMYILFDTNYRLYQISISIAKGWTYEEENEWIHLMGTKRTDE